MSVKKIAVKIAREMDGWTHNKSGSVVACAYYDLEPGGVAWRTCCGTSYASAVDHVDPRAAAVRIYHIDPCGEEWLVWSSGGAL